MWVGGWVGGWVDQPKSRGANLNPPPPRITKQRPGPPWPGRSAGGPPAVACPQLGAVGTYRALHPAGAGLGYASVTMVGLVLGYYNILLVWTLHYVFDSFQSPLPWAEGANATAPNVTCPAPALNASNATLPNPLDFSPSALYFESVVQQKVRPWPYRGERRGRGLGRRGPEAGAEPPPPFGRGTARTLPSRPLFAPVPKGAFWHSANSDSVLCEDGG